MSQNIIRIFKIQRKQASFLRVLGFACNRTWIYSLFFSSILFSTVDPNHRQPLSESVYLVSISILALSLAIYSFFHQRTSALLDSRFGFLLGPSICALSITPILIPLLCGIAPQSAGLGGSAIGTGIGSSLILLDIGRSYQGASTRTYALETLTATTLAAAIVVVLCLVPVSLVTVIMYALPFGASLCAKKARTAQHSTIKKMVPFGESVSRTLLIKLVTATLILGTTAGFMRNVYSTHSSDAFGFTYNALFSLGAVVAALALAIIVMANRRFSVKLLYKPVILICIVGFALAPSFELGTLIPYLLITIGYTVFEVAIWIMLCDMSNRFQYTFVQVFGTGRSVSLIGIIIGGLVAYLTGETNTENPSFLIVASTIAISLIIVSYLYILTERDLDIYDSKQVNESNFYHSKNEEAQSPAEENPDHFTESGGANRRVPLMGRCKLVGAYYGLTPREVDVFRLLTLGRTAARIKEELVISTGTVNTHTYHIYQKLDVHSQQELIDLMQAVDLNEIQTELAKREPR